MTDSQRVTDWYRLGCVEYVDGLELQRAFQERRKTGEIADTLLTLQHPPVLTLGRGAHLTNIIAAPEVLQAAGVSVFETDRGGDVTYHGPGQIVGYPLLFLEPGRQDVRKYVRNIEELAIRTLADFDIGATRMPQWPGVWVEHSKRGGPRKICALGVHLSRWYTRHGFALNVQPDLTHFELIVPCGIKEAGVTSMAEELGRELKISQVEERVAHHFSAVFGSQIRLRDERVGRVCLLAFNRTAEQVLLVRSSAAAPWCLPTRLVDTEGEHAAARALGARELGHETQPAFLGFRREFLTREISAAPIVHESAFSVSVESGEQNTELHQWFAVSEALQMVGPPSHKAVINEADIFRLRLTASNDQVSRLPS